MPGQNPAGGWCPPSEAVEELGAELAAELAEPEPDPEALARLTEAAEILREAEGVRGSRHRDPMFVADPTVGELLTRYGVPSKHHRAAREAFAHWLGTWYGNLAKPVARSGAVELQRIIDTTQDSTLEQLVDRARGGR